MIHLPETRTFREYCVMSGKKTKEKVGSLDRYPSVESRRIGRRTAAGNDRSGPGVVAVARIYGEVPDWFRLRVVCTKGVSIRDRSIRARDISTSPRRIYRDSGA